MNLRKFPFDKQICPIIVQSLQYGKTEVLTHTQFIHLLKKSGPVGTIMTPEINNKNPKEEN